MCGICGFNWNSEIKIREMSKCISHRGPDSNGIFCNQDLSLGQLRLAVIDLSNAGHQPMFYSKKNGASSNKFRSNLLKSASCAIVFNGEIYNFQQLREELSKKGYVFGTKGDTEVILASYLAWGEDCVKRFNGMWAFAIYDLKKKVIFCSRDRVGKKPFYYHFDGEKFIFASELKAIMQHDIKHTFNKEAIDIYLTTGFIPSPMTIYNEVSKLEARHNLVFDLKKKRISIKCFYPIPKYKPMHNRAKLIAKAKEILDDSTRLRLIADVPVGAFLSGGLDSSAIVATMARFTELNKLHTFSIGFEGKYDESEYIQEVRKNLGTRHHHYYFKEKDFDKMLGKISFYYDEPYGDYSNFPTLAVSGMARKEVTVALSGDGGDEIFGGYTFHKISWQVGALRKIPRIIRKAMLRGIEISGHQSPMTLKGGIREALRTSLAKPEDFYGVVGDDFVYKPESFKRWSRMRMREILLTCQGNFQEAMVRYDLYYNTLADNFMVKVDRASMAHALEVRSPFLDVRFLEFESILPVEWKASKFKSKILMREVIKDLLPQKIVTRGKKGFTPPIQEWIKNRKYQDQIRKGLENLHNKGHIDNTWYAFYNGIISKQKNLIYAGYEIRLLLLIKWFDMWGNK